MSTLPQYHDYAELAYFTSNACKHCADRAEFLRLRAIERSGARMIERRRNGRAWRL